MWNTVKVSWAFFAASRKPMSRSAFSVVDSSPARMSITVTCASALDSVSKIFIWSAVEVHVHHFGDVGMEALERALRRFGVEGAGRNVVGDEIVEQRPRDGRLADAALVRAHHNHCRLCHARPPRRIRRGIDPTLSRKHGRTAVQFNCRRRTADISPILCSRHAKFHGISCAVRRSALTACPKGREASARAWRPPSLTGGSDGRNGLACGG